MGLVCHCGMQQALDQHVEMYMLRLSDMKDGPMYNAEATAHEGTVFSCNLHMCTREAFLHLFCLMFHLGSAICVFGQLQSCNLKFAKAQLRHACS